MAWLGAYDSFLCLLATIDDRSLPCPVSYPPEMIVGVSLNLSSLDFARCFAGPSTQGTLHSSTHGYERIRITALAGVHTAALFSL